MGTSADRAYLASANTFAQIRPIGRTSDMRQTLSEISQEV